MSEGWAQPRVGSGVGQHGVGAIHQCGGVRAPDRWHASMVDGTRCCLAGLGDGPIGASPRVMNSTCVYIYRERERGRETENIYNDPMLIPCATCA
jgi:hypothetical protein